MKLQNKLKQNIVIIDGGFGTTIEANGHSIHHPLWASNLLIHQPEEVLKVHQAFIESGADILMTNTYQASIKSFESVGIEYEEAKRYLTIAVDVAKQAAKEETIIAGTLGPYGAMLGNGSEYTGDYQISEIEYMDYHKGRLDILIQQGISVFGFETIPSFEEIKAVKKLIASYEGIECWISVTLKDGHHISDGTSIKEVFTCLKDVKNLYAVGVNCTSVKVVNEALEELLLYANYPLIIYPNGGRTYDANNKKWLDKPDESFIDNAKQWKEKGVKIIGGCCQIGPSEIKKLKQVLTD